MATDGVTTSSRAAITTRAAPLRPAAQTCQTVAGSNKFRLTHPMSVRKVLCWFHAAGGQPVRPREEAQGFEERPEVDPPPVAGGEIPGRSAACAVERNDRGWWFPRIAVQAGRVGAIIGRGRSRGTSTEDDAAAVRRKVPQLRRRPGQGRPGGLRPDRPNGAVPALRRRCRPRQPRTRRPKPFGSRLPGPGPTLPVPSRRCRTGPRGVPLSMASPAPRPDVNIGGGRRSGKPPSAPRTPVSAG